MHQVHREGISSEEKRRLWDEIIADFETSGEKSRPYSLKHGLKLDHLNYYVSSHRRKLRRENEPFIPLSLPPTSTCSSESIEVCSGHLLLRLPISLADKALEKIIEVLKRC